MRTLEMIIVSAFLVTSLGCGHGSRSVASSGTPASTSSEVVEEDGQSITILHGVQGSPAVVGCADGRREGFHDLAAFPSIAGCQAFWEGPLSMRAPATGRACGDGLGGCAVPADACGPGWRVCGASGALADLKQVTGEQCESAGGGHFSAAVSHCKKQEECVYDDGPYECFASGWCSEPVCCGQNCASFGECRSGIWPEKTHIPSGTDQGCGGTTARRAGGVLCCKN
jgi:hypothetical protein